MLVAKDIYNIAKALSKEEFLKLYNIIKSDINKTELNLKNNKKLPNFSKSDSLRYILNNVVKKN